MDIDDQGAYAQNDPQMQNYGYDKIGNLIKDEKEKIAEIKWSASGKVTEIIRTPNSSLSDLLFRYDAFGNRVSKTEIYPNAIENVKEVTTYYVRDAQGNVMATYNEKKYGDDKVDLALTEQHLYGSSRIGMRQVNELLIEDDIEKEFDLDYSERILGQKNYELTNHLGNVLAVVSDKKLNDNEPDVKAVYDYFPFGMQMPDRTFNGGGYRYGFNGFEVDSELKGNGNHISFNGYGYDPRISRRFGLDPIDQIDISNYVAFADNPILFVDPDGKVVRAVSGSETQMEDAIKSSFVRYPQVQKLFQVNQNGQMNPINDKDFKTALKGLEQEDVYYLANAYRIAINDRFATIQVQIASPDDIITNQEAVTAFGLDGARADVIRSGSTRPEGESSSFVFLVQGETARYTSFSDGNITKKETPLSELMAHEVLGHAYLAIVKEPGFEFMAAIQMGNLEMRVRGAADSYRAGADHNQRRSATGGYPEGMPAETANYMPSIYTLPFPFTYSSSMSISGERKRNYYGGYNEKVNENIKEAIDETNLPAGIVTD